MQQLASYFDDTSGDGLAVYADGGRLRLELAVDDRIATLWLTRRDVVAQLARALGEFASHDDERT